jgi:PiT family inorganic phosphate transporter
VPKKYKAKKDLVSYSVLSSSIAPLLDGGGGQAIRIGLAIVFMTIVGVAAYAMLGGAAGGGFVIAAAVVGAYMAMNVGANDVANTMGPPVGSGALTLVGALTIAAIFEAAGAYLAGGDVVSTISKGIINPENVEDATTFIWLMMAALLSAALWINLATWFGAPVSTTHSIVGGVLGAGVAAAGAATVNWPTMGAIAVSWVISPVLGGMVAAAFLYFLKKAVLFREDKLAAARRWVPVLVGIMAAAFAMYLAIKGLQRVWSPETWIVWALGAAGFVGTYFFTRPLVEQASEGLENRKKSVNQLFTVPLIFSAALLAFAHGANDVANAVGPLAAIVSAVGEGGVQAKVAIPLWVMVIGGLGIGVGLLLFGPKLIRTVGKEITRLNQTRAFCVALSAAITVIIASWLGLPVSSTHIAVGGVFGVGLLREWMANKKRPMPLFAWAETRTALSKEEWKALPKKDRKKIKKWDRRRLVRRQHLLTIISAWLITVPASAFLAAVLFVALTSTFG